MEAGPASMCHEHRVQDAHAVPSPLHTACMLVHTTLVVAPSTGGHARGRHEGEELLAVDQAVPGVDIAEGELLVKSATSLLLPLAAQVVLVLALSWASHTWLRIPWSLCCCHIACIHRNLFLGTADHHLT